MKRAPDWFIRELIRVGAMYVNGRLSSAHARRLKRYRHDMQSLARCRSTRSARKTLIQRGGLLPLLLPIIGKILLGAAVGAAGSAIIRKITK